MKNQSLRGKLDVSMICIGAIELGSKLVRVKECGESKCKVSGFLPGPHVMDALYGMVEQALGYAGNECGELAQPVQIKDDEWAPYAGMKSHIGVSTIMTVGKASAVVRPRVIGIGEGSIGESKLAALLSRN